MRPRRDPVMHVVGTPAHKSGTKLLEACCAPYVGGRQLRYNCASTAEVTIRDPHPHRCWPD